MAELPLPCSRGEVHPFQHRIHATVAVTRDHCAGASEKEQIPVFKPPARLLSANLSNSVVFLGAASRRKTSVDGGQWPRQADGGDSQANEENRCGCSCECGRTLKACTDPSDWESFLQRGPIQRPRSTTEGAAVTKRSGSPPFKQRRHVPILYILPLRRIFQKPHEPTPRSFI